MSVNVLRMVLCLIVALSAGCVTKAPEWPPYVVDNMWIPKNALVGTRDSRSSYKVFYTVNMCYPAKDLISEMAKTMTAKGWRRLSLDPVNPSIELKLNHALGPDGNWSHGVDPNMVAGYDWREFWEDGDKNVIHYVFKYKLGENEHIENACTLSGYTSYMSAEQVHALLKAFQEMPITPP